MKAMDELVAYLVKEVKSRLTLPSAFIIETEDTKDVMKILEQAEHQMFYTVKEAHEADILIVPRTSARLMAEISQGYGELESSHVIIHHLANGKRVWCIEEGIVYRKYEKTCPEKLMAKWLSYEREARDMGLEITSLTTFGQSALPKESCVSSAVHAIDPQKAYAITQKLITEKVIMATGAKPESTLHISSSAIVTPLAQDYLRQLKLSVTRQEME